MNQLEGFVIEKSKNLVCKLKKSSYGLKQSLRCWYRRFDDYVTRIGFKRSKYDHVSTSKKIKKKIRYIFYYM